MIPAIMVLSTCSSSGMALQESFRNIIQGVGATTYKIGEEGGGGNDQMLYNEKWDCPA